MYKTMTNDRRQGPSRRAVLRGATFLSLVLAAPVALADPADNNRLPSGQFVTPTATPGSVFMNLNPGLANFPNYLAGQAIKAVVSPDKRTLVVLTSGYNTLQMPTGATDPVTSSEFIFFYDISAHTPRQTQVLQIPTAYAGMAFTPDGNALLVGSGGGDSIYRYARTNGVWAQAGNPIPLGHAAGVGNNQLPSTAGLAITADGTKLLVANIYNDSVSLVSLVTGQKIGELDLRPGIENPTANGIPGGEAPFNVVIHGNTAYVGSLRDREVDVLDLSSDQPVMQARIPVLGNPIGMVLNRAGTTLYVSTDNDDMVHQIDTASRRVVRSIPIAAPFRLLTQAPRYRGVAPNALALTEDERVLLVSNGGENAVAGVVLGPNPTTVGLLPTGWYPNSVATANGWFYAVNGKSDSGPNPGHCQSNIRYSVPQPPPYVGLCKPNQYVLQLEAAGLTAGPIPTDPATLLRTTVQVGVDDGFIGVPNLKDVATMAVLHQRIKHVIYIVKENRTYDQLLGDLGEGNGDPKLVEFGAAITPNFHAFSKNFVDLDNFEDSGEVSGNGWQWSTAAREADFNVKTIPLNYSGRPTHAPYNSEGQNRRVDVGINGIAARTVADPNYPNDPNLLPGTNDDDGVDGPQDDEGGGGIQHGYLWNSAIRSGLSVRNYGFYADLDRYSQTPNNFGHADTPIPEDRMPYADGLTVTYTNAPSLTNLTDPYFRGYDNSFPDYWRVQEWKREFANQEATGTMPNLSLLRLMHDHMGNFSAAIDGVNTPELQQADDDYAVGMVADAVAHSKDANDTLIFVVEDDAQDGPDHVDAHRSTAYVIGPYVRQGAVIDQRYTTVSMLRTIEDILGIQHLNINDQAARPMTEIFDLGQRDWTYDARPSQYLYATMLPLPTRQANAGPVPMSTHNAAWWARATRGYDWSHEDRVPAVQFNEVVWHGLFGARPYPTTRSGVDYSKRPIVRNG